MESSLEKGLNIVDRGTSLKNKDVKDCTCLELQD